MQQAETSRTPNGSLLLPAPPPVGDQRQGDSVRPHLAWGCCFAHAPWAMGWVGGWVGLPALCRDWKKRPTIVDIMHSDYVRKVLESKIAHKANLLEMTHQRLEQCSTHAQAAQAAASADAPAASAAVDTQAVEAVVELR